MDIVRSAKYILGIMVMAVTIFMGSCTSEAPDDTILASAKPSETGEQGYTVSFRANGQVVKSELLEAGEFPEIPEVEAMDGTRLGGWVDKKGRKAQPAATPVESDCEYTAVFFPVLDGEGPYLFTDGGGLLHPDAVLNSAELITALNALAGESAREMFPDFSTVEDDISVEELRVVLSYFYTSEELDRVILGHNVAEKLSRSQFAEIMNAFLGRDDSAMVVPLGDTYRIPDVSPDREDYELLMEAAVAHGHSENGCAWADVSLPALYKEGFVLVDGSLYLADADGFFIRDTVEGSLTFGYDGRYTSGDANLDAFVSAVIADVAEVNSYTEPSELLSAVYDYCCQSFDFMHRNIYGLGAHGWEIAEALTMFEAKNGNSYGYTAVFWALARGLGFEALTVNGALNEDGMSHAWVEIEIEGENFVFDPAAEAGALEGVEAGADMFMLSEKRAAALGYLKG